MPSAGSAKPGFVYGPVPSRRLGFSLGVDILPFKTCTLDCVYCQLGPSSRTTARRRAFFDPKAVLRQVRKAVTSGARIDNITLSGSGEPTLNRSLGEIIRGIKKMTDIPVVVLTNGTLLHRRDVSRDLREADIVVPNLDAATPGLFARVNRPDKALRLDRMIEGLARFRREFKGQIWLEVMLVAGINDSPAHVRKLRKIIDMVGADKVQLNTVVRPPAERAVRPLSESRMKAIRKALGPICEIAVAFPKKVQAPSRAGFERPILAMVRRRPVTASDIAASLGRDPAQIAEALARLVSARRIMSVRHAGKIYYEPLQPLLSIEKGA
jgi:wyosine [tRNA(Phe)-imidazoG37] synthetase (radical SAM superfamily)